jgi:hypothetical protein
METMLDSRHVPAPFDARITAWLAVYRSAPAKSEDWMFRRVGIRNDFGFIYRTIIAETRDECLDLFAFLGGFLSNELEGMERSLAGYDGIFFRASP